MADSNTRKVPPKLAAWFNRHYMLVINVSLLLFLLFTIIAPIAIKLGWEIPGKALYLFYSKFCHQFAYRSWFLFGRQAYYPKYLAADLLTYEEMFGTSAANSMTARTIIGNDVAGYKIAICQRDFAMYALLLLSGLIFALTGKRLKKIPLWLWFVVGVLPLGLDGITQLFGPGWHLFNWVSVRESTPLLRSITGGLFGLLSGWYIFPVLETALLHKRANQSDLKRVRKH